MASDLAMLILIPASSHSAANRPSACRRSWSDGANKTTSSAKSRDEIVWSPNQTHSSPWLHLEILSIKIMSPTCTGNKSDLLTYCPDPLLPEYPPQDYARDTVECLIQIHKTHVDWLGKLPCTLQHPGKDIELVQCSPTGTKTTLFLLKPSFCYRPNSLLQYPGIDFPGEYNCAT